MGKIKLTVAYDGTDFSGFQRQPGKRTVQGTLEETLTRVTGETISVTGAGRTDAGVHALGQVIHFETSVPIPTERWVRLLNASLPRDLLVTQAKEVPREFHARYDACWKHYRYTLDTCPIPDLFRRRYQTHYPHPLSRDRMQRAARHLTGTHDFTSFSAARAQVKDRRRSLYHCEVKEVNPGVLSIEVVGDGFLYHMVRILTGTLVEIGAGKIPPDEIRGILKAKDRSAAGKTFPPEGLVMVEVGYTPWERGTVKNPIS
ncbi:tRNA pseudouridine(38-40) synthase TruA [Kroppenstedtia eburnea]|uniref:tRNA pseudouridine synthase A n=1 Tax=Kroppenstedtia eburnea TaxID=714067 RepID=A0A1N7N1M7_9BACL|nr:tRNA pseudouridine(38-40) synthase TruA [Kroppenstedtia eburnea]EGK09777.1 tRNA pseudouridine synthase A [Desmospora sp. 8437]QKI80790.1 tRNA pseudouridine(38-40) synthase TruA [Kroppenstedtia eburnea]SIS92260.1 tRNA pseudouridine38-40 synthase [Kroppenstedtia eburnea]